MSQLREHIEAAKANPLKYHRERARYFSIIIDGGKSGRWQDVLSGGMRKTFEMYFKHKRKVIALEKILRGRTNG